MFSRKSYKLITSNPDKLQSTSFKKMIELLWSKIVFYSYGYSAYTFLPILLILQSDWVYHFYLQYVFIALAILIFFGVIYSLQDRLLFHPAVPPNATFYVPFPAPQLSYEPVVVPTSDGEKLRGFFIKTETGNPQCAPTVIYFHGNAGNVGSPSTFPITKVCGANVCAVDYRGYGKSSGWPSERGLYLDGKAIVEYVTSRNDIDPNKIVLFGHSMGGAVAIHLAAAAEDADYKISAVIIENTFTTLPQVAGHIFRGITSRLGDLPFLCYSNKFLSIDKISSIRIPICFICGERDEIVNPNMMKALFESCNSPQKVFLTVRNGGHNDTWCSSFDYHNFIRAFLNKVFNEDLTHSDQQDLRDPRLRGRRFNGSIPSWGSRFDD